MVGFPSELLSRAASVSAAAAAGTWMPVSGACYGAVAVICNGIQFCGDNRCFLYHTDGCVWPDGRVIVWYVAIDAESRRAHLVQ